MNILMIGLYPPHIGGVATHIYHLKKELEKNHNVYVLTYGEATDGRVFSTFAPKLGRGLFFSMSGLMKIRKIVKQCDIDVIHAHYILPPGFVGLFGKRLTGTKLVISAHGSDVNRLMKKCYGHFLSGIVLKKSDYLIANSKAVAETLKRYNRTELIYNGVDLDRFYPKNYEREGVTCIGALIKDKGVETLLKAWDDPWIVGDGPERLRLEALGGTFFGYRSDTEEILNKSKVLVLPSKKEGFGIVLLEAMACGTPVIARDIPGVNEIVKDRYNGLLFKKDSELNLLINKIIKKRNLREKLVENGLKTVKNFGWAKTAGKVLGVYKDLLE
ncbi:MAG: glycosyltransferase family 4 protein [Euryarchaeota archaeon]|nr:glycosyltransferase family 4 protein [Euryarchaeota archaeon]